MRAFTFFVAAAAAVLAVGTQNSLRSAYASDALAARESWDADRFSTATIQSSAEASLETYANMYGLHVIDGQLYFHDKWTLAEAKAKLASMLDKVAVAMSNAAKAAKTGFANLASKLKGEEAGAEFLEGIDKRLDAMKATQEERDAAQAILAEGEAVATDKDFIVESLTAALITESKLDAINDHSQVKANTYASFCKFSVCMVNANEENCKELPPFADLHKKLEDYKANGQTGVKKDILVFMAEKALWLVYKVVGGIVSLVLGAIRKIPFGGNALYDWMLARNFHCQVMLGNTEYSTECYADEIRKYIIAWNKIWEAIGKSPLKWSWKEIMEVFKGMSDKPTTNVGDPAGLTKCIAEKALAAGEARCKAGGKKYYY